MPLAISFDRSGPPVSGSSGGVGVPRVAHAREQLLERLGSRTSRSPAEDVAGAAAIHQRDAEGDRPSQAAWAAGEAATSPPLQL
jgi:hypothetical protein